MQHAKTARDLLISSRCSGRQLSTGSLSAVSFPRQIANFKELLYAFVTLDGDLDERRGNGRFRSERGLGL